MKQLKYFVAALAIAITAGALAQQSGGFPSRPIFQQATAVQQGEAFIAKGTAAGIANVSYVRFKDSTGAAMGYVGDAASGDANITLGCNVANCTLNVAPNNGGTQQGIIVNELFCTTACSASGIQTGQKFVVVKGSNTARASTTTITADPDLQFTNVPSGTYRIWLSVDYTTAAGGFRAQILGMNIFNIGGTLFCVGTGTSAVIYQGSMLENCTTAGGGGNEYSGTVQVSGPTTLAYGWAQSSSNAGNTTVQSTNSSFMIERIQ